VRNLANWKIYSIIFIWFFDLWDESSLVSWMEKLFNWKVYAFCSLLCPLNFLELSNNRASEKVLCRSRTSFTLVFCLSIMHICQILGLPSSPSFTLHLIYYGSPSKSFDFSLWLFYDSLSRDFGSRTEVLTHSETEGWARIECPFLNSKHKLCECNQILCL